MREVAATGIEGVDIAISARGVCAGACIKGVGSAGGVSTATVVVSGDEGGDV